MPDLSSCQRCDRPIPPDGPHGSCPACLLALALETPEGAADTTGQSAAAPTATAAPATGSDTATYPGRGPGPWPVVPGYDLLGELGAGGGGYVYRARQRVADREVAVKVLPDGGGRVRFEREVRALAALDHPHVVRVFEVGEADRGPFFSMELLTGGSLASRIRRDGPLAPADAAAVVEKAARGVAAAHARNVLHRDLKPGNVLLDAAGEPKVADFGLARDWLPAPDGPTAEPLTPSGAFIGTPGYAAPEQAAGRSDEHDVRTDVYGLGAVLYQGLTGDPPFTGENPAVVLHRVLTAEPAPPRVKRRGIPPGLEAICLKCLARRPADRYPSAAAVADDLARWRRGEPTVAVPPGPVGRARQWARRHRGPVRAAALTTLAAGLIVLAAMTPWRSRPEDPVARMNRDLRAGSVTVIPAEGLPDWAHWALGAATLGPSPMNDGTCSFQTIGTSLVDFSVPDMDRYRVTVEVRQLRGRTEAEAARERDYTALAVGRRERVAADGARVHSLLAAGYSESQSANEKRLNKPGWNGGKGRSKVEAFRLIRERDALGQPKSESLAAALPFVPNGVGVGPWRGLQADVTPEGVQFRWRPGPDAPFEEWEYVSRAAIEGTFARLAGEVSPAVRDKFRGMPYTWDPRAPVGVYAISGQVSIRNLVLEPLPGP